jgi:hypothetical protein
MTAPDRPLSKTLFLRGQQCPLRLYLSVFEPDRLTAGGPEDLARMEAGREVGRVALGLFPGGVHAGPGDTADLLPARPPAIFEAALAADGLSARIDILARGRRGWRLIEVKSSTSVKAEHLPDVAFQFLVARRCGLEIESVEVLHLNGGYLRRGELDLRGLFTAKDVTAEAQELAPAMELSARSFQNLLRALARPEVAIGPQCVVPRDCDGIDTCWVEVPAGSVLEIANLTWKKKFALYRQGIARINDVPAGARLPKNARRHVDAHQGKRPMIDRPGLRAFLGSLVYPVYLLDFETVGPAIPRWDDSHPYDRIPFQYSLHIIRQPGAAPEHAEFLAEPGPDPRPALLDSLLSATAGNGTILAYHMPFELGVMRDLAEAFPDRRSDIEARIPRMDDLIKPFRAWSYWLPEMGGSFSIKSVAPAIAPELSYEGLEVAGGLAASRTYEELLAGVDDELAVRKKRALLTYCEQDTLAMVRILQAIERVAGEP